MPASTSARSDAASAHAGPMVATIFVRRGMTAAILLRVAAPSVVRKRDGGRARPGVDGKRAALLLDAKKLVVLRDAIRPRGRAGLDLARVRRNREVGDRRVLRLPGAVRDHGGVAVRACKLDRIECLGERPDLVDLEEDRVRGALVDAATKAIRIRYEDVVADELDGVTELARQCGPRRPVVLGERILDRDDRIPVDEAGVKSDDSRGGDLAAFEAVRPVAEELGRRGG